MGLKIIDSYILDEDTEKKYLEELHKNFNFEAEKQGSRFRIKRRGEGFFMVIGSWFWDYSNQIFCGKNKQYKLVDPVNDETIKQIKPILEKIKEIVIVEK